MDDVVQIAQIFAPAKINLTLHVTDQRHDGYHLLDSLVMFADVGDTLTARISDGHSIRVTGSETGAVPLDMDNLVLRVAGLFGDQTAASFELVKSLPVASGIGGGSADAAAAFRALTALVGHADAGGGPTMADLLALGADIPMCVGSVSARVRGIGEAITPLTNMPPLDAVLVNPRRAVATPTVFKALGDRRNPAMPEEIPQFENGFQLADWVADQRNDLEVAAMSVEPVISQVKAALAAHPGCLLARMSGSGATCFGLFGDRQGAQSAASNIAQAHPDWWVKATQLGDQNVQPQLIRSTT